MAPRTRPDGTPAKRRIPAVIGAALLLALTLGSAPAHATIIERENFSGPYDFVAWDCGYPMRVVGEEKHRIQVRADAKSPDVLYFSHSYRFDEVWTAADGRSFRLSANGLAKDVRAKHIDGSLYEFTFKEVGQPLVVTDSSGAVVYRDRGSISASYTFDFASGAFNFLGFRVAAPHPLFDLDLCEAVQPLTGGDSDRYLTPRPLGSTDSPMGYYEYLPPSYTASGAQSPVLLAFNGYGENGDGSAEQLANLLWTGIPRFINVGGWPTERPLVVLAAQHVEDPPGFDFGPCDGEPWGGSCNMQRQHDMDHASPSFCTTPDEVHDFISYAVAHYNVDPARVYITGLSCGAFGAWEYLAEHGNEQVAAAVLIAGDGRPADAGCGLDSVAIWAIHGQFDDVVDPRGSIDPMTELAGCAGVTPDRARLTIYPELFHDGWDQAYSGSLGDDIYAWMLGFSNP